MAIVTFATQDTVTGFGFDFETVNISTFLRHDLTVHTATDLQWQGSGGLVSHWSGDVLGTGMTPVLSGKRLADVTSGEVTGLQSVSTIKGLATSVDISGINVGAAHFFDLAFAKNWKGLFNDIMGGNDRIAGAGFDDTLSGGGGNDHIFGGAGNDVLIGGAGHDTLTGGAGVDEFLFNAKVTAANADTITDFAHGTDHIGLSHQVMAGLGDSGALAATEFANGAATTTTQHILYDSATGWVSYDPDGSGAVAAVHLVHVDPGITLTAADFLVV